MKKPKDKNRSKNITKQLKELREGEIGESLSDEADINNGVDSMNAADTTAFPTYINEKGQVVSGKRTDVNQQVPPKGK